MFKIPTALLSACLTLACPIASTARQQPPAADSAAQQRASRVRKAVADVETAMALAGSLTVPENRLRVHLAAADLVWKYDEPHARAYYADASKSLASVMAEIAADDPEWQQKLERLLSIRQEVVNQLAPDDAALALAFLAATRPPAQFETQYMKQSESQLEVQVAQFAAVSDSKRALDIGLDVVAHGSIGQLVGLVQTLQTKDPDSASTLAARIVERLATGNLLDDDEAPNALAYLLQVALAAAPDGGEQPADKPLLDDAALRRLIGVAVGAQASASNPMQQMQRINVLMSMFHSLRGVYEIIDRRVPDLAPALRQRDAEIERLASRAQGIAHVPKQAAKPQTADEMLAAARTAGPDARDGYYQQAFFAALSSGNVDRATQIAGDEGMSPAVRAQLLENVDRQRMADAMQSGRVDEALGYVDALRAPSERSDYLLQIAAQAFERGDGKTASRILAEAETQAGPGNDTVSFQTRLQLAPSANRIDPGRGFGIVDASVDKLNVLLSAAAITDGFGCERSFEDGELLLRQEGTLNSLVYQTAEVMGGLAVADADRARAAALRFERPEPQILALLRVAAALLAE